MTRPLPLRPPHPAPAHAVPARDVRRAVLDARGGVPVLLLANPPLIVLPAETASDAGLAELRALASGPPMLLLAATRAASVLHQLVGAGPVVALSLPAGPLAANQILALADPTQAQANTTHAMLAPPPAAAAALVLAKLGRLLPALVAAPIDPSAAPGLLRVQEADLLAYHDQAGVTLTRVAEARMPLAEAEDARLVAFRPADGGMEHLAVLIGQPEAAEAPLVRVHSECFTGDLLGSLRCDCGPQLHHAIRRMQAEGAGVLLYMAQEGRGIGLVNKLRAYALQDAGLDTLDANRALGWGADERSFIPAATMLKDLGITRIRLLTNNPDKIAALAAHGIDVAGRVSHAIEANGVNDAYLETKLRRFGHLLG